MSVRNFCFVISDEKENESRIIHPNRVSSFLITSPSRISTPALILASEYQIPVILCNQTGRPVVRMWSSAFLNTSLLRRRQYHFCESIQSMHWASGIIHDKVKGQTENLRYLAGRKPAMARQVNEALDRIAVQDSRLDLETAANIAEAKKRLLSFEAYAAAHYWQLAGTRLPLPYLFTGRVKRNPEDAFNACINYLYGMLRNNVETAILSFGLDPALGIMHRDGYRMPSLVFDMMEPFRPVMDKLLFTAILNKTLPDEMMDRKAALPRITKEGRKALIQHFNNRLHTRAALPGKSLLLNNLILSEVKQLTDKIKKP
jgi:CRISPR-associated protein Cas1